MPDLLADYCEIGDYVLFTCLDQFCWDVADSNCCPEPVFYAAVKRTAQVALLERFLMTWIRFVLMLYFFMIAHKFACQTLSKAFLKSMKTW